MIDVQGLTKLYEDFLAVDDVSFALSPQQICGLVGPNGAGKTTTLRCLAGLIPATAGVLNVAGCDLSGDLIQLKQRLAYVPDDPPLFDDLTVGQHLGFIGKLYGVADYVSKSNQLLDQFKLADKANAGALTLSRGMRQKLAICCAYLFDPQVLLLDEPLTGLDPPGIRTLLASIQSRAAAGATVVISSHLLAMIEDVCTQLLVMQNGQVEYFGAAEQLLAEFPEARSLEEAYFAATHREAESAEPEVIDMPPITIPIAAFQHGVRR